MSQNPDCIKSVNITWPMSFTPSKLPARTMRFAGSGSVLHGSIASGISRMGIGCHDNGLFLSAVWEMMKFLVDITVLLRFLLLPRSRAMSIPAAGSVDIPPIRATSLNPAAHILPFIQKETAPVFPQRPGIRLGGGVPDGKRGRPCDRRLQILKSGDLFPCCPF